MSLMKVSLVKKGKTLLWFLTVNHCYKVVVTSFIRKIINSDESATECGIFGGGPQLLTN